MILLKWIFRKYVVSDLESCLLTKPVLSVTARRLSVNTWPRLTSSRVLCFPVLVLTLPVRRTCVTYRLLSVRQEAPSRIKFNPVCSFILHTIET